MTAWLTAFGLLLGVTPGCTSPVCGPAEAKVTRVIDGDTVKLETGQTVRYLMVNAPEATGGKEDCYGGNAVTFNTDLVLGRRVSLGYDDRCTDDYGRLLAYVSVAGVEVNTLLIERGFACALHIPPTGDARATEFADLQAKARAERRGLWGHCDPIPCN